VPDTTAMVTDVARPAPALTAAVSPPELVELVKPSVGHAKRKPRVPRLARRAVGPVLLLIAWYLVCHFHMFTSSEVASPAQTWDAAKQLWSTGQLQHNLWVSLHRVIEGLGLGVGTGLVLAVISGFFNVGEDLLDPALQALRAVPVLGVLPLFIVWFGIGETPKVFLIALGCLFPVYLNTYGAIRGVDSKLIEAGQTFGLGRLGVITNVVVPGALPGFLVGLRFALVNSWLGVIIAEQINAQSGLGYLITEAQTVNRTDIMFVALLIFAALGILADALVRQLEKSLLVWRRGFSGS